MPAFIAPQLATRAPTAPDGEDWVHEIKYDGYRIIAVIAGGRCQLFTRTGKDWTRKFEPTADALVRLDVKSAVLDGELVVLDKHGKSDFGRLHRAMQGAPESFVLFAFDLLQQDGDDLRQEPLLARKERLRNLLGTNPPAGVKYSDHVVGDGRRAFTEACKMGLEGIVSKRSDSPYVSKRTTAWIKVKCMGRDEFVIGGYRISKNGRLFSSLLLGEYEGSKLKYRGRVGTGFDSEGLERIGGQLAGLERKSPPFTDVPREIARDARWVSPQLVAEIAYTERTADGVLRHPSFLGLRVDKSARDVRAAGRPKAQRPRVNLEL